MSEFIQNPKHQDQVWMQRAITLAKLGQYSTKPNPNVGCVIVKNGQLVGEGFHPKAGQPHAEVFAMREAGEHAKGATAYVTLEPCAHYGRTPPCAKGLVNLGFLKTMATGMPYVRLKVASSLDGRTAMASGESKWITGREARQDVQHWRAISGAVITGIETVLADDCQLNVRQLNGVEDLSTVVQPLRIVLDRQGRLPLTAKILEQSETVMVMGPYRKELEDLGVIQLQTQPLKELLQTLAQQYQIYDVLVEAGATLSTAFLKEQLVDELISYVAPTFLGQTARAMFNAEFSLMAEQLRFKLIDVTQVGNDVCLKLIPSSQETV